MGRKVDKSRTFLIQVDEDACIIKWLDFDRSKAMPMQFYSLMPSQSIPRSHLTAPVSSGNVFTTPSSRLYQLPMENIHSNSQFFPMDNHARQYMHQILPQQQAQYAHWQNSAMTSIPRPVGTPRQFSEDTPSEYTPNWYQEHYEGQVPVQAHGQANPRTWANYANPGFDAGQLIPSNLISLQQSRAASSLYPSTAFPDADPENSQFSIQQSYQYHGQY